MARTKKEQKSTTDEVVSRDYTVRLQKALFGTYYKNRAPAAIKALKKFAMLNMGTKDVRIDSSLNKHLWSRGVGSVPGRVRVRISRKRDETEGAEGLYSVVSHVPVESFKGLTNETVSEL